MGTYSARVPSGNDDGSWFETGYSLSLTTTYDDMCGYPSVDLGLANCFMRFTNVAIPQGTPILTASLYLRSNAASAGTGLTIRFSAIDADNAAAPTTIEECEYAERTTAFVAWVPGSWSNGSYYTSASLVSIIQEIIDRPGWTSGNSIVLLAEDGGTTTTTPTYRRAYSYNGSSTTCPRLDITWYEPLVEQQDAVLLSSGQLVNKTLLISHPLAWKIGLSETITAGKRIGSVGDSISFSETVLQDAMIDVPQDDGYWRHQIGHTETIAINKRVVVSDGIHLADAPRITRGNWEEVHSHPHTAKLYMAVKTPRTVWTGRVASDRGSNQSGDLEIDLLINVTGGANASGFDINNFLPDLTLWVGSTAGGTDHGKCRVRSFSGTNLVVSADMTCVWKTGDYLTITDLHEYWPRPHKVVADGSSVTVYKDTDIPVASRVTEPVPIFGPPVCVFLDSATVSVPFHGGQSYLIQPDSNEWYWDDAMGISAYAWWFEGADVTTASGADVTAVYSAPGQYVARLTVTGENGQTASGFRNVFVFERTGDNAPIEHFDIKDFSGSLSSHGWECQADIFGDLFDPASLPQAAQIVIFSEEWYAGAEPTFKFGNPSLHGRDNIKMVGWIADTSLIYESGRVRGANVTIQGLQKLLESRGNFPCYWTQIEAYAPAWSKFWPGAPEYGLTVRKVWYHTIRWHWTLFNFTDVFIPDDHNNYLPGQNFPEGTLASWLTTFCEDTQANWVTDKGGALYIFSIGNYLPIPGLWQRPPDGAPADWPGYYGMKWRQRLYTNLSFTDDDFERLEIQPRVRHEVARVRAEGVMASDTGWYATSIDMAPGDIRGLNGTTKTKSNQVLGTGGFYGSQGYELALMMYAEESRNVERIRMTLAGNYSFLDIAPYANWFTLTVSPSGGLREVNWTNKPFWVDDINIEFDSNTGDMAASISASPETWPDLDLGVYSQFEEVGEVRQMQASGGSSSFGALLQSIDTPDRVVVPALMGNGGGLVEGAQPGTSWVRPNGDANYAMQVENRTYDNVDNRPVLLEMVMTAVGTQIAKIIGLRVDDDADADAESSTSRTVRGAIYCQAGSVSAFAAVGGVYPVAPFFVVGPNMKKVVLKNVIVAATFAATGSNRRINFNLYHNTTLLQAFGLTSPSSGGYVTATVAVPATLVTGDRLGLSITAATGASNLLVEGECLIYGV